MPSCYVRIDEIIERWKQNLNSTQWNILRDQDDLSSLLYIFGWFHDSCIREMHMWTDHYVNSDLSMSLSPELDHNVRLLIQRQANNPLAIELLFNQVTQIYIKPSPEDYDSLINEGTLLYRDGIFYWATDSNWDPDSNSLFTSVNWISSKQLSWREVNEWTGNDLRYGPMKDL